MNSSCIATNNSYRCQTESDRGEQDMQRWGPATKNLRSTSIGNGVWSATNTHNTTPVASGFLYFLRPVSYFAAISILCVHGSNNNSVLPRTSLLQDEGPWQSLAVIYFQTSITFFQPDSGKIKLNNSRRSYFGLRQIFSFPLFSFDLLQTPRLFSSPRY